MKINFPTLFQTPLHKYNFFFIFGNEPSVFERTIAYIQKRLSLPIQTRTEDNLLTTGASQPSLFVDSQTKSLSLIPAVTDKILNYINKAPEGIFILTSEKARAQSKLVTYFTQASTALAIAAYASPLTSSEFEFLVEEMVLPGSLKDLLFKTYQNDYMGLLATLEKIKLYGDIPEAQYSFFLETSTSEELSPLLHAFLLKDIRKVTEAFHLINSSDLIPFFRLLARSFQTLYELIPFQKSSRPIPWQSLSSPVFFKDQHLYETALTKWPRKKIHHLLETLLGLEHQVKYKGILISKVHHQLMSLL